MAGQSNNARMLERVWLFVSGSDNQYMRTDQIFEYYMRTYGSVETVSLANMTQTLIRSGLFKREGWYNRKSGEMHTTPLNIIEFRSIHGIPNSNLVCVVKAKPLEEILDAYIKGKRTLRRMSRQPVFVRRAFKTMKEGLE